MHDSERDPVAYSTLPFKVQTTELDYKLHTDRTVLCLCSTALPHGIRRHMGKKEKDQQHRLLLRIHTYKNAPGPRSTYIANIPCENSRMPFKLTSELQKGCCPRPPSPKILTYLSTQQHVNITAAASYVYVPNVFDIHMIS